MTSTTSPINHKSSVPEVLEAGIPAVVQNIRAAQRRVECDDLTIRFFDNAVQSTEMLLAQTIDAHNADIDGYNQLADTAENLQLKIGIKDQEIEELVGKIELANRQKQDEIDDAIYEANKRADTAEQTALELQTSANEAAQLIELRNQQINTLRASYQEVMKLDPVNLEKRYHKAKTERQELRKEVSEKNQQLKKLTKDLSLARVEYAKKKAEATALAEQSVEFANLRKEMWGITKKHFISKKKHPVLGDITFYPRLLAYGISSPISFNEERPYIVTKLDFAYQFCCDMGFALDIRINEWLMPNFQPLDVFKEYQPDEEWIEFFHEIICKEMEMRRPELVRRAEWAKSVMLAEADLPFEEDFIDGLIEKGLHTLFDVVTRRPLQLTENYDLSPEETQRLLDLLYARCDTWEKQNGGTIYVR